MKAYLRMALVLARRLWAQYPARIASALASAIVLVAARFHVVLPNATVVQDILTVVPILLAGQFTHARVTPHKKG